MEFSSIGVSIKSDRSHALVRPSGRAMAGLVRVVTPDVRRDMESARGAHVLTTKIQAADVVEAVRASFAGSCPQKDLTEDDDTSGGHGLMRGSRSRSRQLAPALHVSLP